MASLLREQTSEKLTGSVYTPDDIVNYMLDELGYFCGAPSEGMVLDPACGDGQFLVEIVRRILDSNLTDMEKNRYLENVHGWDIDEEAVEKCKARLGNLTLAAGLDFNDWNISVTDALSQVNINKFAGQFSFVVANPPYIRIQHLEKPQREQIISDFAYCKSGSTDIYLAFLELGEILIGETGKCAFITANSYLTSQAGALLRKSWAKNKTISKIVNFGHHQVFPNASTYVAISFFSRKPAESLLYLNSEYPLNTSSISEIQFEFLTGQKVWNLDYEFDTDSTMQLLDICSIHVGIQTLADKVFFISPEAISDESAIITSRINGRRYEIECALLKPALKASKLLSKSIQTLTEEKIIWPYDLEGKAGTVAISDSLLSSRYPNAYHYFLDHKDLLDARDNGEVNTAGWYAFARQQGLRSQIQPKIVFPPMVDHPRFFVLSDPNIVIYSGYFILSPFPLADVMKVLESPEMTNWVKATGRDFRGGWKSMSKKTLENFPVPARFNHLFPINKLF